MAIHRCRPSGFHMYNRIIDNHKCGNINFGNTYNIKTCCNGGHTGFWGGFGAGLGMGLGNMFGGLFGNFMGGFGFGNMFGGFGFGMPGFGGWGGGLSGLWGGNSASNSGNTDYASKYGSKSSSTCNCDGCGKDKTNSADPTDADCGKIAGFIGELKDLKAPVAQKTYDDLKNRIIDAKTESEKDPKNKAANLKAYDNLLVSLEKYNPAKAAPTSPQATTPTPVETTPANTAPVASDSEYNGKPIANSSLDDFCDLTEKAWKELSPQQKNAIKDRILSLINNNKNGAIDFAKNKTLPSDLRAAVKATFYDEGHTNVSLEEISKLSDEELNKQLIAIIDKSGKVTNFGPKASAIESISNITHDSNGSLKSFLMKAESGTQVTYTVIRTDDGELILHGAKVDQHYVLQRDENKNLVLKQYDYHSGFGSKDVD